MCGIALVSAMSARRFFLFGSAERSPGGRGNAAQPAKHSIGTSTRDSVFPSRRQKLKSGIAAGSEGNSRARFKAASPGKYIPSMYSLNLPDRQRRSRKEPFLPPCVVPPHRINCHPSTPPGKAALSAENKNTFPFISPATVPTGAPSALSAVTWNGPAD